VMGHGKRAELPGSGVQDREIYYTDVFARRNGSWQSSPARVRSRRRCRKPTGPADTCCAC
jgi:hypothetical protein